MKIKTIKDGSLFRELFLLVNPYKNLPCTKEKIRKYNQDARDILSSHGMVKESKFDSWYKDEKGRRIQLFFKKISGTGKYRKLTEDSIEILNKNTFFGDNGREIIDHLTDNKDSSVNKTTIPKKIKNPKGLKEW